MNVTDYIKQVSDIFKISNIYSDLICTGGGAIVIYILSHTYKEFGTLAMYFFNPGLIKIFILISLSFMAGYVVSFIYDLFLTTLNLFWNYKRRKDSAIYERYEEASLSLASITFKIPVKDHISGIETRQSFKDNDQLVAQVTFLEKCYLSVKFISTALIIYSFSNISLLPLTIALIAVSLIIRLSIDKIEIGLARLIVRDKYNKVATTT